MLNRLQDEIVSLYYAFTNDARPLFWLEHRRHRRIVARMQRGKGMNRIRMQHREHAFSGKGETCDDCGLSKRNSVHGDMNEIAGRIAEREDREYAERHRSE